MQWQPGFYWKEKEGKRNTFVGASMQSYEVAILLWEELAMPPALMWQWQILHEALVRASGGEATSTWDDSRSGCLLALCWCSYCTCA